MFFNCEENIMREVCKFALILKKHFNINFARVTLIAQMVLALIKVRTVCLSEVATGFAGKAKASSNEKRIQRFLRDFPADTDSFTRFVGSKLPEGHWILTTDRTYWEFGKLKINILMLAVVYKGVAIPLCWKFLGESDSGKKGNSATGERIELMTRFIRLFGVGRIGSLCADREFIGSEWFSWLRSQGIPIFIRIRENQYITDSKGIVSQGSVLFRDLKSGGSRILRGRRKIGDVRVYISGMKLPDGEFLIVASFDNPGIALETYAQRWQIETMFACLKTKGFRFEDTHLTDLSRIDRLLGIVSVAFVWAYLVGDQLNEIQPIHIKKLSDIGQKVSSDTDLIISEKSL
jgi:hypothetical protein